ncbi:MAG: hypothetical protein JOZ19_13205 [Rubrobacter sp.]|nr:hypothetical protein [Rubrobacter sp.]
MTREEIEQAVEEAGWDIDEGFSAHLLVGANSTVSILAHKWVWRTATILSLSSLTRRLATPIGLKKYPLPTKHRS